MTKSHQHRRRPVGGFRSFLLVGLMLVATFGSAGTAGAQDKLRVVTTLAQIADVARNVGGDLVDVQSLMGPGVDPHLYKASEGDIGTLLEADLILYNGLNLEGRMADVLVQLANQTSVVAVSELIPEDQLMAPEEFQGHPDPHIWFDPTLWAFAVERVQQALAELDPANAETYAANADAYIAQLEESDAGWQEQIATIPEGTRILVTAHDAFNYFGRHFGIEVIGLQGISTETEAGVGDIQRVADRIVEAEIPAIFVESSVSPRTIEAVQAAVQSQGHEVAIGGQLFSDAMGEEGTPEGTYIGMVDHNVKTIAESLSGSGE